MCHPEASSNEPKDPCEDIFGITPKLKPTFPTCIIFPMPTSPLTSRPQFVIHHSAFVIVFYFLLASCGPSTPPTPTLPPASPTPAGPQVLNICLGDEPSSLYLYADNSAGARAVRQAIYDESIIETLPSLENGGIAVQSVTAHQGDRIVDPDGNISIATADTQLDQLSVTFMLKSGLTWSDGTPLTADDSIYSFELAASPDTPTDHYKTERTASYVASDERTVVWTGLPGYSAPDVATNFWSPLPRHVWGTLAAADLLINEASTQKPIGWGPYMINAWNPGQNISLSRNPNYFRAAEQLPHFSTLNFIFEQSNLEALQSGTCDLAFPSGAQAAQVDAVAAAAQLQAYYLPADSWMHLDFSIQPHGFDDGFNVFDDRADFFSDVRMRQAIAQCIDRQAIINALAFGKGSPPNTYVPAGHPLHNASAAGYAFDPAAANALLDQLGWFTGADGVRVNQLFPGALGGQRLELTLATSDSPENLAAAELIKNSLDDCGIAILINSAPAELVFATGASSSIFGRNFDLALFSWPFGDQPACYLYLSEAIPGDDLTVHKYGWGGWNVSGWYSAEFDAACKASLTARPGDASAALEAQRLFAEQLPALPIYVPYEILIARAHFCGLNPQPGSDPLQDLETFGYAEWCQ